MYLYRHSTSPVGLYGLIFILLLSGSCSLLRFSAQKAQYKYFGVSSGIVQYKISGAENGSESLHFDHYGRRSATHLQSIISSGEQEILNLLTIVWNDSTYSIDLDSKEGLKSINQIGTELADSLGTKNLWEVNQYLLRTHLDATITGQESILGHNCDIWHAKLTHSTFWFWNGILLKSVYYDKNAGKTTKEAIQIVTELSIPPDKFEIPSDISWQLTD